jgi:hypothetical protein
VRDEKIVVEIENIEYRSWNKEMSGENIEY